MKLYSLFRALEEINGGDGVWMKRSEVINQSHPNVLDDDFVLWSQVKNVLSSVNEVLSLRSDEIERLEKELENSRSSDMQSRAEADDESAFLEDQMEKLSSERNMLQQRVQELQRDKQCLEDTITLMRAQLADGGDGAAAPAVVSPMQLPMPPPSSPGEGAVLRKALAVEKARSVALEKEVARLKRQAGPKKQLETAFAAPSYSPRIRAVQTGQPPE